MVRSEHPVGLRDKKRNELIRGKIYVNDIIETATKLQMRYNDKIETIFGEKKLRKIAN